MNSLEEIIEKMKVTILDSLQKREHDSDSNTDYLDGIANGLELYLPELEKAQAEQEEMIKNIVEFHKLNTCYKQYVCMNEKKCSLNFDYGECPYVKIRLTIEKYYGKQWEEIIKE